MGIGTDKDLSMKDTWIQVGTVEKAFDLWLNFEEHVVSEAWHQRYPMFLDLTFLLFGLHNFIINSTI